jgi:hypothetical protein
MAGQLGGLVKLGSGCCHAASFVAPSANMPRPGFVRPGWSAVAVHCSSQSSLAARFAVPCTLRLPMPTIVPRSAVLPTPCDLMLQLEQSLGKWHHGDACAIGGFEAFTASQNNVHSC